MKEILFSDFIKRNSGKVTHFIIMVKNEGRADFLNDLNMSLESRFKENPRPVRFFMCPSGENGRAKDVLIKTEMYVEEKSSGGIINGKIVQKDRDLEVNVNVNDGLNGSLFVSLFILKELKKKNKREINGEYRPEVVVPLYMKSLRELPENFFLENEGPDWKTK